VHGAQQRQQACALLLQALHDLAALIDLGLQRLGMGQLPAALLRQVGMGGFPVIRIKDAAYRGTRSLFLVHEHDGRDLDMGNAEKTLEHLRTLWGHDVLLETRMRGKPAVMTSTADGFDAKLVG